MSGTTPDTERIAEACGLFFTAIMADAAEMPPRLQEAILLSLVAGARGTQFEAEDPGQVLANLAGCLQRVIDRSEKLDTPTWFERQKIKFYLRFLGFAALVARGTRMSRAASHLIAVCNEELDL